MGIRSRGLSANRMRAGCRTSVWPRRWTMSTRSSASFPRNTARPGAVRWTLARRHPDRGVRGLGLLRGRQPGRGRLQPVPGTSRSTRACRCRCRPRRRSCRPRTAGCSTDPRRRRLKLAVRGLRADRTGRAAGLPVLGIASYFYPNQKSTLINGLPNDSDFCPPSAFCCPTTGRVLHRAAQRALRQRHQPGRGRVRLRRRRPAARFIRSSVDPTGGPLVEKNFPVSYGTPREHAGRRQRSGAIPPWATPSNGNGPLYSWLNYNQIPTPGPSPINDPGQPYTSPAVRSATSGSSPAPCSMRRHCSRRTTSRRAAARLDRHRLRRSCRQPGRPALLQRHHDAPRRVRRRQRGHGDPDGHRLDPAGPLPQVYAVAPGYNHLDVLTAAARQNDGQPETSSQTLASWMSEVVGPPQP